MARILRKHHHHHHPPNRTHRFRRKYPRMIYFLHIHKSAGSFVCKQAFRNQLAADYKRNCNVRDDQRCCSSENGSGKKPRVRVAGEERDRDHHATNDHDHDHDHPTTSTTHHHNETEDDAARASSSSTSFSDTFSARRQIAFARTAPYDLVAAEKELPEILLPDHYDYVVSLRNSRDRYASHWNHLMRAAVAVAVPAPNEPQRNKRQRKQQRRQQQLQLQQRRQRAITRGKRRQRRHNDNDNDNDNDNSELIIEQWTDKDFMPEYFLNGNYGDAPNFYFAGKEKPIANQTWWEWHSKQERFGPKRLKDQTQINSHRYRQTRFLSRCMERLRDKYIDDDDDDGNKNGKKTKPRVWMSTIDTDEYLAINPWMMPEIIKSSGSSPITAAALRLEPGSVFRWWIDHQRNRTRKRKKRRASITTKTRQHPASSFASTSNPICRQIPRLLFGSVEMSNIAEDVTSGFVRASKIDTTTKMKTRMDNHEEEQEFRFVKNLPRPESPMESLRWKYHAAPDDERNFQQKVVLDVHNIPEDDEIWSDHVYSVHRPSQKLCPPETVNNWNGALLVPNNENSHPDPDKDYESTVVDASPVVAYHYIGSEDRYFQRKNDLRRNRKRYRERSNITFARDDSGWIDQWLERFVETVGVQTAAALLVPSTKK
uniref:Uncharacterized protein n=1 Tax=Pseudo-nitzschia australis TaxID=44445 RepID=A0A6V0C3A4_9STRA